jgi:hypothetical protein
MVAPSPAEFLVCGQKLLYYMDDLILLQAACADETMPGLKHVNRCISRIILQVASCMAFLL